MRCGFSKEKAECTESCRYWNTCHDYGLKDGYCIMGVDVT